jgi:hypothetical protein
LIFLGFFIADDPFGIFYSNTGIAEPSEDVVQTRNYLKSFRSEKYTAFVFGNSRSHAFTKKNISKHIGHEKIFDFSSPGESLLNIDKKLGLILSKQEQVHYAIILIDDGILENTDNKYRVYQGPVYNHSPVTSNVSYIKFYANYLGYYFDDYFFLKHICYKLTGTYKTQWMESAFKNPGAKPEQIISHNYSSVRDSLIATDFNKYKSEYKPDYSVTGRRIRSVNEQDLAYLQNIALLLKTNHINYKIILPPDFHKQKVAPQVYYVISKIFGDNSVYDFTGVNRITTDSTLNYENLHFTEAAGEIILDSIFRKAS